MSASNKRSYDSYAGSAGTGAEQKAAQAARLLKVKNQIHTMVEQIPPQILHNFFG
jgi:hypothetical protein